MKKQQKKILIVEDELLIGFELRLMLEDHGYEVVAIADTGEEAVRNTFLLHPDLILMDIQLRGRMTGIEAAAAIRADLPISIIYLTGNAHLKHSRQLQATNPFDVLDKPISEPALFSTVARALQTGR